MAKVILLEEFHLTVLAPRGLPPAAYDAMRQAVNAAPFVARLRRALRRVFRREAALARARVRLGR